MSLLVTVPGAGAITTPTQYIPQFITIRGIAGADLAGDLTGQINVNGDGMIFNLDAAGIIAMAGIRSQVVAADQNSATTTVGLVYQLAEGLVTGKNADWTFTNADAAAVEIYGWSKQIKQSRFYCTFANQVCLALSGTDFDNFAYLGIPGALAADRFTTVYNDGCANAGLSLRELIADTSYYRSVAQFAIDNIAPARLKLLTITPSTQRTVYVMRYQPVKGIVDSAIIAKA